MTILPTVIQGGNKTNIIPDKVEINFDIRLLPIQNWKNVENYFDLIIPNHLKNRISIKPIGFEPNYSDTFDDPFIGAISEVCQQLQPQYPITPFFMPVVTDARFFRQIGIKCFGFSLLGENMPTELLTKLAHGDDERIPVESLELSYEAYKLLPDKFWKNY